MQSKTSEGQTDPDRRAFIRHPASVPIRVERVRTGPVSRASDVSHGGLSFVCAHPYEPGAELVIQIDITPAFRARAHVAWCHAERGQYRVGVRFLEGTDAFKARLVEQLCAIERYRRDTLEQEGRYLSGEAAAREWIERFAETFPNP